MARHYIQESYDDGSGRNPTPDHVSRVFDGRLAAHFGGREREVLSLLVKGMSNNEIADKLVVSRSTVKFHVSSILSKMGVASRTEAVAFALQNHLIK